MLFKGLDVAKCKVGHFLELISSVSQTLWLMLPVTCVDEIGK